MRIDSVVVRPGDDVSGWLAEQVEGFPEGASFRLAIELITPTPMTTTKDEDMPSGRKVSPWRHYTEKANARKQDENYYVRKREEQNRRIKAERDAQREAQRKRDEKARKDAAERERREREARKVTNRSIQRAREDQRKNREKAKRARDETGRRGGGGEKPTKRWGGW